MLLHEDLPTWRRRYLGEKDLKALRGSPEGAELTALLPKLSAAYATALQNGTQAFTFEPRSGWVPAAGGSRESRTPYSELRIGVYDHGTRRFVPMVPWVGNAYSGVLDPQTKRALIVAGELRQKEMWQVQPHGAHAMIYSLENWGQRELHVTKVSDKEDLLHGVQVWLAPTNAIYFVREVAHYGDNREFYRGDASGTELILELNEASRSRDPPPELDEDWPSVTVWDGAFIGPSRRRLGTFTSPNTLELDGVPVALAKSYKQMTIHRPAGKRMVIRHVESSGCFLELVDYAAKTATVVLDSEGGCSAHGRAQDGTFYVVTDNETLRFAPGASTGVADVVQGVRFSLPLYPQEGGV